MRTMKSNLVAWIILTSIVFPLSLAQATRVKFVSLEELVRGSDRIFSGTCIAVQDTTVPDTRVPVTQYTFKVTERLKGNLEDTVVVSQIGVRTPRTQGDRAVVFRIPGMPVYQIGEEVTLFLVSESPLGLSSPVGLSQGAFTVFQSQGKRVLKNGLNNAGLLRNLSPEMQFRQWKLSEAEKRFLSVKKGPLEYNLFMGIIRKMLTQPSGEFE